MSYFNQPKLEQHLRLKNLNPKTIELYINGVRRPCNHFGHDLREMTRDEFVTYFADLAAIPTKEKNPKESYLSKNNIRKLLGL